MVQLLNGAELYAPSLLKNSIADKYIVYLYRTSPHDHNIYVFTQKEAKVTVKRKTTYHCKLDA